MVKKDFYDEEMIDDGNQGEIHEIKSNIQVITPNANLEEDEIEECEEPGCTKPAMMRWHGMLVCHGHYNFYKAKEESLYGKGISIVKKDDELGF